MASRTDTKGLEFVERSPAWLRWGGGGFLLLIGTVVGVAAVTESRWQLFLLTAAFCAAAAWWSLVAKVTAVVGEDTITLGGPFWTRTLPRKDVSRVSVDVDNGLNQGLVNWPVTSLERRTLTRLNMGGAAAVSFAAAGHRYQFVLADRRSAQQLAAALET